LIASGVFDNDEPNLTGEERFRGLQSIVAMVLELPGFQVTYVGIADSRNSEVLVGAAPPVM